MTSLKNVLGLAVVVLAVQACGEDEQSSIFAPTPVAMPAPAGYRAEVVPTPLTPGFYELRADRRMCMWPYCGGYFIRLVGRDKTECARGVYATECYVASLELEDVGMTEAETNQFFTTLDRVIGLGSIQPRANPDWPSYSALHLAAGFIGASEGTGGGDAYILREHGGVVVARALNTTGELRFHTVDFSQLRVKPEQIAYAEQLMAAGGLVATGKVLWAQTCELPAIELTQIYLPVGRLGSGGK
jgi:uncharacterized protein DUF6748